MCVTQHSHANSSAKSSPGDMEVTDMERLEVCVRRHHRGLTSKKPCAETSGVSLSLTAGDLTGASEYTSLERLSQKHSLIPAISFYILS